MNKKLINLDGKQSFEWDLRTLQMPKLVESDPRGQDLPGRLMAHAQPLWSGGTIVTPVVPLKPAMTDVLRIAQNSGRLVRGLEDAENKLAAESRGLGMVDKKTGASRGERVSRLLVLADDGAERFYRQVERLLRQNYPRALALRLEVNAEILGQTIFNTDSRVLLLLLNHKESVSSMLLAL
jgi:hypothetical protein